MVKYLLEIRNRFVLITLSSLSVLIISYFYKEILLFLLIKPCELPNLNDDLFYFIFTDVTEIFSVYLLVVYFVIHQTIAFNTIFHCFSFFSYALFKKEYDFYTNFLKICFLVWLLSMSLSYYFLIPLSWNFFFSFQNVISSKFILLQYEPKINEYLNFCLVLYYFCIFYCQVFAILFLIVSYYTSSIKIIRKFRKFYYYSFVIFSTLLSPPDILTQFCISIVLIIVYELLVLKIIFKNLLVRQIIKTN